MSIPSSPYFVLDIPTVDDLTGTFKYHYFTIGETIHPADEDITNDMRTFDVFGIPRKIIINISNSLNELSGDFAREGYAIHELAEQILTVQNLAKAEAEAQLQVKNASRVSFQPGSEFLENLYVHPDFDSANDHFDVTFKLLSNLDSESKELITRVLENTHVPGPIQFDPSTNLPIVDFDEQKSSAQTSGAIMDFALGDLVSSIVLDPLSSFSSKFSDFEKVAISKQADARGAQKYGKINLSDYSMSVDPIDAPPNFLRYSSVVPIGIIFYKTRIEGDERIPENPIVLLRRNKKNIEDHSIIYGATYEYSAHTLAIATALDDRGISHQFLLLSKDGKKISIECEERKPPPTVSDLRFRFLDSTVRLEWDLPIEVGEKRIPVNDIKYVQIFRRYSLEEPFKLVRMYDFNDSLQIMPLEEYIPRERIVYTDQADSSLEVKLPEKGEHVIYAASTIDAHGNSSFLSAQFAIYLDSLSQPKIEHISYPGAPKQYPNLTLLEDAFVDSIRASGYKKATIYHNPNFTVLLNGKNRQNLVSAQKTVASYVLQLIDIETQTDERLEIIMHQK